MIRSIILFFITYALLLLFPKYRPVSVTAAALTAVVSGIIPFSAAIRSIEWNVLLVIAGTIGIMHLFNESGMPERIADIITNRAENVRQAIVLLSLLSGIISAFVDNVATVLLLAPIAISLSKKQGIPPVKGVIAVSLASCLQGAATLVGDTTSIILGAYAGMDFLDFFVFFGKPGLFWIIQAGMLAATIVLWLSMRGDTQKTVKRVPAEVNDVFPTILLSATVISLAILSLIPKKPETASGLVCVTMMLTGAVREAAKKRSMKKFLSVLTSVDPEILVLLTGLFALVGSLKYNGAIDEAGKLLIKICGSSQFIVYSVLVWGSVLVSAFVDNIPYVAAMLPVVRFVSFTIGAEPYLMYFGLLCGATLGGNITPIGASANITALGILKREGSEVRTGSFMKLSVPYTIAAVTVGYVSIWLLWG